MTTTDTHEPIRLAKILNYITAGLAAITLLIAPLRSGRVEMTMVALALGALTLITIAKNWGRPLDALEFTGFILLAAWETLHQVRPIWALLGVTAALATWDLHTFRSRLAEASCVEQPDALVRWHLARLGAVALLGITMGSGALLLRVDYGIGAVIALACLLIIGLSQIIAHLRRRSD